MTTTEPPAESEPVTAATTAARVESPRALRLRKLNLIMGHVEALSLADKVWLVGEIQAQIDENL